MTRLSTTRTKSIDFIRSCFPNEAPIPLHRPCFGPSDEAAVASCVKSNFVSSVGELIGELEGRIAHFSGAARGVATVNGTAALHVALRLVGVEQDNEVLTQAVTFVATCNAVAYCGGHPVFVDVDRDTMGLSPQSLEEYLAKNGDLRRGATYNRVTGRRIAACVPMHTFGHPCRIDEIVDVCERYHIPVVEDAAESLGSYYKGHHTGTFGKLGVFSFNGNKIITTGGGGMIVTNDQDLADRAKDITTTAKRPHAYEFYHHEVGYNYRMPNLNAALGLTQMEQLTVFLEIKRSLAERYRRFFDSVGIESVQEPGQGRSNNWLNAIVLPDRGARDAFLTATNDSGIQTRPLWTLMTELPAFRDALHGPLETSRALADRVIAVPSSVPIHEWEQV